MFPGIGGRQPDFRLPDLDQNSDQLDKDKGIMIDSSTPESIQDRAIRVLVVDDHDVVRIGLEAFLLASDDLELAGEAADGEEAIRLCEQLRPDVVLMDLVMPGMDGAAATRAIHERSPHIPVLILTSFEQEHLVQEAMDAGAIGCVIKNISTRELADAIRAAHASHSLSHDTVGDS